MVDFSELTQWLDQVQVEEMASKSVYWMNQRDLDKDGKLSWIEYKQSFGIMGDEEEADDEFFTSVTNRIIFFYIPLL